VGPAQLLYAPIADDTSNKARIRVPFGGVGKLTHLFFAYLLAVLANYTYENLCGGPEAF
jgi:hypothetical protein